MHGGMEHMLEEIFITGIATPAAYSSPVLCPELD